MAFSTTLNCRPLWVGNPRHLPWQTSSVQILLTTNDTFSMGQKAYMKYGKPICSLEEFVQSVVSSVIYSCSISVRTETQSALMIWQHFLLIWQMNGVSKHATPSCSAALLLLLCKILTLQVFTMPISLLYMRPQRLKTKKKKKHSNNKIWELPFHKCVARGKVAGNGFRKTQLCATQVMMTIKRQEKKRTSKKNSAVAVVFFFI